MSENIPESIPTSQDPRSKRPTKRRAISPLSKQAASVEALFAEPDREIQIPDSSTLKAKPLPPPPEIVQNVQGSSAGAGSGEFHVYKAARRREAERLRLMDEETKEEQLAREHAEQQAERKRKDEEKTRKAREKRDKQKKRKAKAKEGTPATDEGSGAGQIKKGPRIVAHENDAANDGEGAENGTKQEEVGIVIHDDD